jgi:hypothetical protein
MWVRIAVGAALFLLGYTLGRGYKRLEEEAQSRAGSARIRDETAKQATAQDPTAAVGQTAGNIVGEE